MIGKARDWLGAIIAVRLMQVGVWFLTHSGGHMSVAFKIRCKACNFVTSQKFDLLAAMSGVQTTGSEKEPEGSKP